MNQHRRFLTGLCAVTAIGLFAGLWSGGCASTSPTKATPTFTRKPSSTPVPSTSTPTPAVGQPSAYIVVLGGTDAAGSTSVNEVLIAGIDNGANVGSWVVSPNTIPTPIDATGILALTAAPWAVQAGAAPPYHVLYGNSAEPMGTSYGFSNYSAFSPWTPGSVGAWADSTPMADPAGTPVFCQWTDAVTDGSYVYLVEGTTGTGLGCVGALSGGNVSTWTFQSGGLGIDWDNGALVAAEGYLFAFGGRDGGTIISSMYRAPYGSGSIGSWTSIGNFPITIRRHNHQAVTAKVGTQSYLYVVGGYDGAAQISTCYYATVDGSGNLGTWQLTSPLPMINSYSSVLRYTDTSGTSHLYLIGGYDGSAGNSTVYKSTVQSNGTLSSWAIQNQIPSERKMTGAVVMLP